MSMAPLARARASSRHALTSGVEEADSWTTDGHKWLNTPYDGAVTICRDADALAQAMNADAVYATSARDAQKNLTLEFSRRARGIPIWAALRTRAAMAWPLWSISIAIRHPGWRNNCAQAGWRC
jgi:glutamate/tyrosine decarboxylase-like PLP-dependent enzyme